MYSDYYSILRKGEDIYSEIKAIFVDELETASLSTDPGVICFDHLLKDYTLLKDKSSFTKEVRGEIRNLSALLKKLDNSLEEKIARQNSFCKQLIEKKKDGEMRWSHSSEEKNTLQRDNTRLTLKLDKFIKMRDRLVLNREFINRKFSEYGDEEGINELYELWSGEYENSKTESETLKTEYQKALLDEKSLPRICGELKKYIHELKEDIQLATYEVKQILKAIPDLEGRARESEELVLNYGDIHEKYEISIISLAEYKSKFENIDRDKIKIEQKLAEKKELLAPQEKTEKIRASELEELTERLNKENGLNELGSALNQAIPSLETKIKNGKIRIENFEKKSNEIKEEIEQMKGKNTALVSELKKFEAIVGPVKDLRKRLEEGENQKKSFQEQGKTLSQEIHRLRKENEMLSIKSKQFEMVRKKMKGIK